MEANDVLAIFIVVAGGLALLAAGYLLGVRRGRTARDALRSEVSASAGEAAEASARLAQALDSSHDPLREDLQRVLGPLLERERMANDLSHLEGGAGARRDLTALLDQIAARGNFLAVALHDNDGWPLASSTSATDLERLGATVSLLMFLADRVGGDGRAAPQSIMVHDAANRVTLSRLFNVNDQRLSLTAVAVGSALVPTTLDPALVSITTALATPTKT